MSRRYNYYSSRDSSWGELILYVAIILFCCLLSPSCNNTHIASEREDANMIYIEEGYCYDAETRFIYREVMTGGGRAAVKPTYTIYINENGNYCKYEYGKWVEFIK